MKYWVTIVATMNVIGLVYLVEFRPDKPICVKCFLLTIFLCILGMALKIQLQGTRK